MNTPAPAPNSRNNLKKSIMIAISGIGLIFMANCNNLAEETAPKVPAKPRSEFLFGGDFDAKAPKQIKDLFYESGMNCIRMTGGGYSWAAKIHKNIADEFAAKGLKVYMQLGSHYPSADYFKYKDAWFVDQAGKTGVENRKCWAITYSGRAWPQYSYAAEMLRPHFTKDFTNYINTFKDNRNIAGVILHNEPGYFWISDRVFDYNPLTIAKFRTWLAAKYQTIDGLNKAWGTNHQSFEEITPPGKPPVENIAAWMDWRRFSVTLVRDFLKWESDMVAGVRKDMPRTTNLDGPLNHWYGYRLADIYEYSTPMDKVGIDIYPTPWTDRDFVPYSMDMLMGTAQERDAHILECDVFSNKLWKKQNEEQRADLLDSELWSFVGHGADAIMIWGFSRGDDFSLTNGEFNERYRVCRDVAHLTKMIGIRNFHRRPSQVAVCVDPDSYLYFSGKESRPHGQTPAIDAENHGVHAAFLAAGIQSDVIITKQLVNDKLAERYRVIALPSAMMMDAELAKTLSDFVAGGGILIVDAPFATMDRHGKLSDDAPICGLDKLLGVKYAKQTSDSGSVEVDCQQGKIPMEQVLGALDVAPTATVHKLANGSPGIVINQYGKGKTIFFAGKIGTAFIHSKSGNQLSNFLTDILGKDGVAPAMTLSPTSASSLDNSILEDSKGNKLVVLASQGSRGGAVPLVKGVHVSIPTGGKKINSAFLLARSQTKNGVSTSGPKKIAVTSVPDTGMVTLDAGDVSAATPILLTSDMTPLLALEIAATMQKGQTGQLKVTCFNPAAQELNGNIKLKLPEKLTPIDQEMAIKVAPHSQQTITLKFKIADGALPGRTAITATLGDTVAAPVDVVVE